MSNFYTDVISKDPRFHSTKAIADPALLEPVTRAAVEGIIADAAAHGIALMMFETYRSQERQALLFQQGATQLRTVGVHHYGLACDLVKSIDGQPSWKGDFSFLGALAKAHGLIWGGDWGTPNQPHSFRDNDHVQRCSVARQAALFRGDWYPDANYNPFADLGSWCKRPTRSCEIEMLATALGQASEAPLGISRLNAAGLAGFRVCGAAPVSGTLRSASPGLRLRQICNGRRTGQWRKGEGAFCL